MPKTFFFLTHLDQGTAFDLLEALEHDAFEIILYLPTTTMPLEPLKLSLDYILKPIDDDEFHVAVQKVLTLETPRARKRFGPVDAFSIVGRLRNWYSKQ